MQTFTSEVANAFKVVYSVFVLPEPVDHEEVINRDHQLCRHYVNRED